MPWKLESDIRTPDFSWTGSRFGLLPPTDCLFASEINVLSDQAAPFGAASCTKQPREEVVGSHPRPQVDKLLAHQTLWRLFLSPLLSTCHQQSDRCLRGLRGITLPSARGVCWPGSGLWFRAFVSTRDNEVRTVVPK